jgi:hypothetical protein
MRATTLSLIVLCVGIMVPVVQPAFAESHDIVSPRAINGEEFLGVNHVLDVLANTNVRRVDRDTMKTFQEYTDIKSAVNNRPVEHTVSTARVYSPNRMVAPRKLNQRMF